MPQTINVAADDAAVGNDWTVTSGVDKYACVDGSLPVDTDYVSAATGGVGPAGPFIQGFTLFANDPTGPYTGWKINIRMRSVFTGTGSVDVIFRIRMQDSLGSSVLLYENDSLSIAGAFTSFEIDINEANATSIGVISGFNRWISIETEILASADLDLKGFEVTRLSLTASIEGEVPTPPGPPTITYTGGDTGGGGLETGGALQANDLVLSTDSSGIYTIVPNQRFDRIYVRNTATDQTEDVRIPNPFIRSGYYGS